MKRITVGILSAMLLIVFASSAFAHSGRTNKDGCHNDTRTGGYHCH